MGAGGEPWKPRLQRLAEARQLAPFEKLVLEVLVGCHVSPSVQRTFLANKPGTGDERHLAAHSESLAHPECMFSLRCIPGFQPG